MITGKHRPCRQALLAILLAMLPLFARGEYFRHLTMNDGLSQPTVFAITQDRLGRMWFGTREGVNVYDGSSVEYYRGWVRNHASGGNVWIGNDVRSFSQDSAGNIYMMIDRNIVRYDICSEQFERITDTGAIHGLSSDRGAAVYISNDTIYTTGGTTPPRMLHILPKEVKATHLSIDRSVYYVGSYGGLYVFDPVRCRQSLLLPGRHVYSSFVASDGSLYISLVKGGLYRYREGDDEPVLVSLPAVPQGLSGGVQTRDAIEGRDGLIWYGSFTGLFSYNPATGETHHIQNSMNRGGLNHSSVLCLHCDREGNIWVGTYYGGVNYFSSLRKQFVNFDYEGLAPQGLFLSTVIDMVHDRHGNLWFGTDGAGVCCVDPDWNIMTQLSIQSGKNALRQNNVRALAYDSISDRLFIGTHLGGLSIYDVKRRSTTNLIDRPHDRALPDSVIDDLVIRNGKLYVAARSGLYSMDLKNNHVRRIRRNRVSLKTKIDFDPDGNIYMIDRDAVVRLHSTGNGNVTETTVCESGSLGSLTSLLCTDKGLYVGTLGNGLFFFRDYTSPPRHFSTENSSIRDNYCYSLNTDGQGHVFILTSDHIVRMDASRHTFENLLFSDFFPDSHIIAESNIVMAPSGDLLVGSTKGVTVIHDYDFSDASGYASGMPSPFFSSLRAGNRRVVARDQTGMIDVALPFASEVVLDYNAGNIDIVIGFNDYNAYSSFPVVEYRLDGMDEDWRQTENRTITYSNLPPGRYRLQARLSGGGDPVTLDIKVKRPWYDTWWAWLFYISAAAAVVYVIIMKSRDAARLRIMLTREKLEREQIEQLNKEKLIFFTNISHEFQTPLTLIMSHIDLLIARYRRHDRLTETLRHVRDHARQMSQLVIQLLEFRQLQQGYMKLKLRRVDASGLLRYIASSFNEYAGSRNMSFIVDTPPDGPELVCDPKLLERVILNIISNAFKYTPDGGTIRCKVETAPPGDSVRFVFSDTGRGISSQDLPFIFDRFYNGSTGTDGTPFTGHCTGIGLAYVRTIVEHHHGEITVQSQKDVGSVFVVTIPSGEDKFAGDSNVEWQAEPVGNTEVPEDSDSAGTVCSTEKTGMTAGDDISVHDDRPLILIVEDQAELRENLVSFFAAFYNVTEAADGQDGLEKTRSLDPTLIISDVMMPRMSGTEMCRSIKADLKTCHIPVILLTALDAQSSRMEGLNSNADDYVTKPFDSELLLARVDNLLRNRRLLQNQFEQRPIDEVDMSVVNPLDRELLKRVTAFVEQHIDDPELDIPMVSREVGMSLSLFFNKFKAVTGMTPNNFILRQRLQTAATLLEKSPHLSITEIAEKCGFATVVYFRRVFKKQYGVSPQQYRKEN